MNTKTFFRWLEMHKTNAEILDAQRSASVTEKLVSTLEGGRLHHLWENEGSRRFITRFAVGDEKDEYIECMESLLGDGRFILLIDEVCFSDAKEPVSILVEKESLITVLKDFYLYLDEIYIFKNDLKWVLSVNHRFCLYLYGDESDVRCMEIYNKIRDIADKKENGEAHTE